MDNDLYHWKYLKREKINGEWRYWYNKPKTENSFKTNDSLTAYRPGVISNFINAGKQITNRLTAKATGIVDKAKDNVHKYVEKVPTEGDAYRYFYSAEAYKAYIDGKNTADKLANKKVDSIASDESTLNSGYLRTISKIDSMGSYAFNLAAAAFCSIKAAIDTPNSFSELKKIDAPQTNDEHQAAVNPDYKFYTYDYSQNCTFCTAAYDLRKRGYDVEANPISVPEAYTLDSICSWYKGAEPRSEATVKAMASTVIDNGAYDNNRSKILSNSLEKNGEGARGHLCLEWSNGGGHDIVWEVENGKVVYRDCQLNTVVNIDDYLDRTGNYHYVRTDHLEMTDDILRTVRNRKGR